MILRKNIKSQIAIALRRSRIVALIGPRQCGKTTLAREWAKSDSPGYFDLEDPAGLARLEDSPMEELKKLKGLVVIDEIQRRPDLFPLLRVLADRRPLPARFLILGSSSPELIRKSSESLTGRLETVVIGGFSVPDVGIRNIDRLWLRGGLPPSYVARSENDSLAWRKNYVRMFLERDIPRMGITVPAETLRRFWTMVAHYHGQIWNSSELASAMGISEPTIRRYLDLLEGMFMVRQLRPWHENLKKRQVKAPKVYLRDTGLLHQLLGIRTGHDLFSHPKSGASWEGFVIEETLKKLNPEEGYFWATHNGAELDLFCLSKGRRIGIECKRTDAPRLTLSMRIAMKDLKLDRLFVIYPGQKKYTLAPKIEALPIAQWLLE